MRGRPLQGGARASGRPKSRCERIRDNRKTQPRNEVFMTSASAAKQPAADSQHLSPKSDIEISQAPKKRPIVDIARERLGIAATDLEPYGHYKAKLSMDFIDSLSD